MHFLKVLGLKVCLGLLLVLAPISASALTVDHIKIVGDDVSAQVVGTDITFAWEDDFVPNPRIYVTFTSLSAFALELTEASSSQNVLIGLFTGKETGKKPNQADALPGLKVNATDNGDVLGNFSAGQYTLAFFDNGSGPRNASLEFALSGATISSIPLPAGMVLLLGALGGLGAVKLRGRARASA